MSDIKPKAIFEAVLVTTGNCWYVLVAHPKGPQSHLGGFKTEIEAKGWIATRSADWLKEFGANHD
jgi:hypothetical protein